MFTSQCPSDTSVLYSSANSRSLIIMDKKIQSNRDISGCPESSWQRAFYQGMLEQLVLERHLLCISVFSQGCDSEDW